MTEWTRAVPIRMKADPEFTEKWLQGVIASDPAILGLGELRLLSRERRHPGAGRLDLLLADDDAGRRYEVELQLGAVDAAHIIRTIEYWDIERKRYPQYDHCAVIVAEEITARFLNVIGLFNGHIPLIAMKVQALRVGPLTTLVFTRVLDELVLGDADEASFEEVAQSDRAQWQKRIAADILAMVDRVFGVVRGIDDRCELNYTKGYIGLMRDKMANNFVLFKPRKKSLTLQFKLPQSEEYSRIIDETGLDTLPYEKAFGYYRLQIRPTDLEGKMEQIKALAKLAHMETT